MGDYTELVLGVELKRSTPDYVINILKQMLSTEGRVIDYDMLPDHTFFQVSNRWQYMLLTGSYYFDGQPHSELRYDDGYGSYYLTIRCNFKNYRNELDLFLDWICRYIESEGFIGYERFEYAADPTLIYKLDDIIQYKQVAE